MNRILTGVRTLSQLAKRTNSVSTYFKGAHGSDSIMSWTKWGPTMVRQVLNNLNEELASLSKERESLRTKSNHKQLEVLEQKTWRALLSSWVLSEMLGKVRDWNRLPPTVWQQWVAAKARKQTTKTFESFVDSKDDFSSKQKSKHTVTDYANSALGQKSVLPLQDPFLTLLWTNSAVAESMGLELLEAERALQIETESLVQQDLCTVHVHLQNLNWPRSTLKRFVSGRERHACDVPVSLALLRPLMSGLKESADRVQVLNATLPAVREKSHQASQLLLHVIRMRHELAVSLGFQSFEHLKLGSLKNVKLAEANRNNLINQLASMKKVTSGSPRVASGKTAEHSEAAWWEGTQEMSHDRVAIADVFKTGLLASRLVPAVLDELGFSTERKPAGPWHGWEPRVDAFHVVHRHTNKDLGWVYVRCHAEKPLAFKAIFDPTSKVKETRMESLSDVLKIAKEQARMDYIKAHGVAPNEGKTSTNTNSTTKGNNQNNSNTTQITNPLEEETPFGLPDVLKHAYIGKHPVGTPHVTCVAPGHVFVDLRMAPIKNFTEIGVPYELVRQLGGLLGEAVRQLSPASLSFPAAAPQPAVDRALLQQLPTCVCTKLTDSDKAIYKIAQIKDKDDLSPRMLKNIRPQSHDLYLRAAGAMMDSVLHGPNPPTTIEELDKALARAAQKALPFNMSPKYSTWALLPTSAFQPQKAGLLSAELTCDIAAMYAVQRTGQATILEDLIEPLAPVNLFDQPADENNSNNENKNTLSVGSHTNKPLVGLLNQFNSRPLSSDAIQNYINEHK